MATSKCGNCKSTSFEIKEANIRGTNFINYFVQCSSCGTVINSAGYYDAGVLLKNQEETLNQHLSNFFFRLS